MEYASLLSRFIALVIDSVIVGIIGAIIQAVSGAAELGFIASFVIGVLYQIGFLSFMNGQTPGKMLLGIRVVDTDGGGVNPLEAGLRYVGYYINTLLLLIGWLWAIPDARNQGFHDKIAGTVVIKA